MITCFLIDGKPTDIRDIGGPLNMTDPSYDQRLEYAIAKGRRLHTPSVVAHIKTSHWVDDGRNATEVVDAVYSQAELDQQAADAVTAQKAARKDFIQRALADDVDTVLLKLIRFVGAAAGLTNEQMAAKLTQLVDAQVP